MAGCARLLGIRLKTLYGLINSGDLPAYKIGRVSRLRRVEVTAYVGRCRIKPGTLGDLYPAGDKVRHPGVAASADNPETADHTNVFRSPSEQASGSLLQQLRSRLLADDSPGDWSP